MAPFVFLQEPEEHVQCLHESAVAVVGLPAKMDYPGRLGLFRAFIPPELQMPAGLVVPPNSIHLHPYPLGWLNGDDTNDLLRVVIELCYQARVNSTFVVWVREDRDTDAKELPLNDQL